jgi:hypothetical protein
VNSTSAVNQLTGLGCPSFDISTKPFVAKTMAKQSIMNGLSGDVGASGTMTTETKLNIKKARPYILLPSNLEY